MPAPATVRVQPLDGGGLEVTLSVPTYNGTAEFDLRAERDADGDWRVFIPWTVSLEDQPVRIPDARPNGKEYEFLNGIAYLGAPESDPAEEGH